MSKPAQTLSGLSIAVKLAVIVLSLAYIGEKANALHNLPFTVGSASHNVLLVFAFWAELLRPGFALCALWAAANVLGRLGKGDAFGPAMLKGMRGVGLNLMFGAFAGLILVPTLSYYADGHALFQPYGMHIESLTFGLIGLVFYILASQGQTLKSELEQYV